MVENMMMEELINHCGMCDASLTPIAFSFQQNFLTRKASEDREPCHQTA